jgi:hypothetical protein
MPDFQTLDKIADAFNPAIGLAWIFGHVWLLIVGPRKSALARFALAIAATVWAYALMAIKNAVDLQDLVGLSYSTHSGVTAAFVLAYWLVGKRIGAAVTVLALLYGALILHQGYHTPLEVIASAAAVTLPGLAAWAVIRRAAPGLARHASSTTRRKWIVSSSTSVAAHDLNGEPITCAPCG